MLFSFVEPSAKRNYLSSELLVPKFDNELANRARAFIDEKLSTEQQASFQILLNWSHGLNGYSQGIEGKIDLVTMSGFRFFFAEEFLASKSAVVVKACPEVPYHELGLSHSGAPQGDALLGLAFSDPYFVREELADWLPLHFHELVHLVQREILGDVAYIGLHFVGLLSNGYYESPLEKMAYKLQNKYCAARDVFDVVTCVHAELKTLLSKLEEVALSLNRLQTV